MTNKKRPKITDIAGHLGISITTVSFILNGKGKEKGISDILIEKVLRYTEEVNYKPNALAKSFRTGKTNIIGLLVEDISNPFFATIARLIEERAYAKGYRIIYCSTKNDPEKTRELLQMFRDQHVDGYIIAPPEGIEKEISQLTKEGLPVVIFDRYNPRFHTDQVIINNYESVQQAIAHLVDNRYKRIGFVTIVSGQSQMTDRFQAYKDVLKKNRLKEYALELPYAVSDTADIIAEVQGFCRKHPELDAVFFANNFLGVYGLEAIKSLPGELLGRMAFISFDDHDLFRLYSPSITAIQQPFEEMADRIVELLFDQIAGVKRKARRVEKLDAHLILRESSKQKRK